MLDCQVPITVHFCLQVASCLETNIGRHNLFPETVCVFDSAAHENVIFPYSSVAGALFSVIGQFLEEDVLPLPMFSIAFHHPLVNVLLLADMHCVGRACLVVGLSLPPVDHLLCIPLLSLQGHE